MPIKFGDATKLKKGQIVIALGNPYAIARDGQASASWGIVANLTRKDGPWLPEADERPGPARPTLHQYGTLIQTDARLNLGTSGGALLNLKGEMVGLDHLAGRRLATSRRQASRFPSTRLSCGPSRRSSRAAKSSTAFWALSLPLSTDRPRP